MTTTSPASARHRCRLRPRLPPVRRAPRWARRGDVRAVQGVDPSRARYSPVVAAEGRAVHAARHRHDPGDRQRRHRLRHPRPDRRAHPDHHVPRVRRRLERVARVRRHRRARRPVSRPPPARAAAALRPPDHRRRLRASRRSARSSRSCSRSRSCRRSCCSSDMLVSDSALDYTRDHADVLWKVPVAVALLAAFYSVLGVAIASLTSRRIVAGASFIGLFLVTSITSGVLVGDVHEKATGSAAALINVLATAAVPARPRVPRPHRPGIAAQGRRERRAVRGRRVRRRPGRRGRRAAAPLPVGGAVTLGRRSSRDPAFVDDATVEVTDVSVWFGQKVALSELSCSFGPGVTGLLGPNGAGKTTLMRAITGMMPLNQGTVRVDGRDPRRDRSVHSSRRSCRRTKPCRPGSPPASSSVTSPTCTR